jgi:hypothetical protein
MYNLTITQIHTYYVHTIADRLVHNECLPDPVLDSAGETYVRGRHYPGGSESKGRRVFDPDEDHTSSRTRRRADHTQDPKAEGHYERTVEAGRPIGTTRIGQTTSRYKVVQDVWGSVRTMHPVSG